MQLHLEGFDPPHAQGEVHRLFFALWPDDATRVRIAEATQWLKAWHRPQGRWIGAHRYHLTLQFLGDFDVLPETLATRAGDAAASVKAQAFDLSLDQAGSFRNRTIPWWLGCEPPPQGLHRLHETLGVALGKAGVAVKSGQRLRPHVTVLRDADSALPPTPMPKLIWPVREFVLIHSVLGAQSAYTLLGRWPLHATTNPTVE